MQTDRKNGNTDLSRKGFVLNETEEEVESCYKYYY